MATRVIQNSFAGGELTPAVFGRHDLEAYYKGAAKIENFVVLKTGGLKKRPGIQTSFAVTTTYTPGHSGRHAAVIPYQFDRSGGGVLILTQETGIDPDTGQPGMVTRVTYRRKTATGAYLFSAQASALLPAYIWPESATWEQVGDAVLIFGLNGPDVTSGTAPSPAVVAQIKINHLSNTITAAAYACSAKPATPSNISISAQGADMIVTAGSSKARTLHYAAYAETGGVRSNAKQISLCNINAEWPAGCSLTITATIRPAGGVYPDEVIIAKRSGALFGELARLQKDDFIIDGNDGAAFRTYEFTDENHLAGTALYKQTALLGASTHVSAMCSALYQQRMVFAGLPGEPFSILFSRIGDFYGFHANRPIADDDPFRVTLATDTPAHIRFCLTYRDSLIVFTDTGVWRISGSSSEGFTPRTCQTSRLNNIGCSPHIKPVATTDGVVFLAADDRTVYELRYELESDAIAPIERSVLADHLTQGAAITSMTHQRYPGSVIWFTLTGGTLISLSYQPEHELYAWARHTLSTNLQTKYAHIVCALGTNTDACSDVLVMLASLSGTFYWIARMTPLDHADGPADGGAVPVRAELTTLRPELPDRNVQGIPKNIVDCLVRVRETQRLSIKPLGEVAETSKNLPSASEPSFTGNIKIMPRGFINDDGQMTLVSDEGPCEIQCVVWKVEM